MLSYPLRLRKDGATILAVSPDFPELTTFGIDRADALRHAVGAFEEAIAARMARRQRLPSPSAGRTRVELPTQTALKILVYQAMQAEGLTKAGLARRLHWHAPQVDRLLDIRHATRLDQMDAALNAMGRRLSIDLVKLS